jgi:endonuclease/exonuclease/phosphatase family metal-dependent hydrolase
MIHKWLQWRLLLWTVAALLIAFQWVIESASVKVIQKEELVVMTYNIRHAKGLDGQVKLDRVVEVLQREDADIIALQEVDRYNPRSHFKDQVKHLAEALNMHYSFAPTLRLTWMEYGNAVLSRYPVVSSSWVPLPGKGEPRIMMTTTLSIQGMELDIVNVHLGVKTKERESQFLTLHREIKERHRPTILLGDFNMGLEEPAMRSLQGTLYTYPLDESTGGTVLGGGQIDHIFANFPMVPERIYSIDNDASDHKPVLAELSWRPELLNQIGKLPETEAVE